MFNLNSGHKQTHGKAACWKKLLEGGILFLLQSALGNRFISCKQTQLGVWFPAPAGTGSGRGKALRHRCFCRKLLASGCWMCRAAGAWGAGGEGGSRLGSGQSGSLAPGDQGIPGGRSPGSGIAQSSLQTFYSCSNRDHTPSSQIDTVYSLPYYSGGQGSPVGLTGSPLGVRRAVFSAGVGLMLPCLCSAALAPVFPLKDLVMPLGPPRASKTSSQLRVVCLTTLMPPSASVSLYLACSQVLEIRAWTSPGGPSSSSHGPCTHLASEHAQLAFIHLLFTYSKKRHGRFWNRGV